MSDSWSARHSAWHNDTLLLKLMPLASILIPVYNREDLIERTMRSAMVQTIQDIEIIVVENQSTDRTHEIALSLAASDHRIKIYRNAENIGPVLNWVKCVEYASSAYSKILFSDDLIAPSYLECALPHMISPKCGFVYTPAIVGSEDWKGNVWYSAFEDNCRFRRDSFLRATTYIRNFAPDSPGAALFRTRDLLKYILTELPGVDGYDFKRNGAGVDWLIYVLTALNYPYIYFVSEPLVYFREHQGSISVANEDNQVQMGYRLAKQWFASLVQGL